MVTLNYFNIVFLCIGYFLIIPIFVYLFYVYYKQQNIIKNFYGDVLEFNNLNLISKTNTSWFFLIRTSRYILILCIFIIIKYIVLLFLPNYVEPIEGINSYYALLGLYILPYLIISLIWYFKIKKIIVSNQDAAGNFKDFIKSKEVIDNSIFVETKFYKEFSLKEKHIMRYLKWVRLLLKLNRGKQLQFADEYYQDWNKCLYLFTIYLYLNYWNFKKMKAKLSDDEFKKLKVLIFNNFLTNNFKV